MINTTFTALVVRENEPKVFTQVIEQREISDLPEGDIVIKVAYSSLNYKDALSATGNPGVSRNFPHSPGIDAVGEVVESRDVNLPVGTQVVVTGYDLGMNTSGGLSQYIRVPAQWVVPLPSNLTPQESMSYGTAGFTAALMVNALVDNGVKPADGEILVTGATGGVGSVAVAILAKLGYNVCAVTGKSEQTAYLKELGATTVVARADVIDEKRPMLKERWAGVVDVVGGAMLSSAIKATKYTGTVTCSGMVGDINFTSSIFPFILRGVKLIGIDSVECPMDKRLTVWNKMASNFKPDCLSTLTHEISLNEALEKLMAILDGKSIGRSVVKID
jgi:acrylyl-CoA reductase (NADPH)